MIWCFSDRRRTDMRANIVTEFFSSMKDRGLSQADAIRLINKNCNRHYNSSRVCELMRGKRAVPNDVLRYMVRQTLEDILSEFDLRIVDAVDGTFHPLSQRQVTGLMEKLTPA